MSYDYEQKLKHPKWQKKRLEVLERDGWKCMVCKAEDETLHIHHLVYSKGEPWDSPLETLESLCWSCHEGREEFNKFFGGRTKVNSRFCMVLKMYLGFAVNGDWGDDGKKLIDDFMASARVLRNRSLRARLKNESDSDYATRMIEINKLWPPLKRRAPFVPPPVVENVTAEVAK